MDDPVQARAYAEEDYSGPHQACVEFFRGRFPGFEGGAVADLGCGPADVTIRFARACPGAHVTGVDGSGPMLRLGRAAVARARLARRIALRRGFIPGAAALRGRRFDAVISNSLLHHLPDPADLWATIREIAGLGAPVFVMDLRRPATEAALRRLVRLHAAAAPPILRRDFESSLRASFTPSEVRMQLRRAGLAGMKVEIVSDRHLVAWGRA